MTTAFLAPAPIQNTFFIPGSNTPGSGVQLFLYVAGSVSTKQTAYQESTASTPWANPIVLDSGGNLPSGTKEVWFVSGQTYKAVYAPSNDTDPPVSPYLSLDNLAGINDTNSSASEWVAGPTPTFISSTSFSVAGDQTLLFTVGRRTKSTVTAGTVYGTIISSIFGGGITTVTLRNDSTALDSGLSAVSYGLLQATNPSIPTTAMDQPTQTVTASSTTLNLASTGARSLIISSTNPVSTMPIADGQLKHLEFSGTLTLFNSTSMVLPGGANISTAAGDTALARGESGAITRILMYQRATTSALPIGFGMSQITNSLSGDVSLNNTGTYFDGPTVAQGTTGTWFASGSVTVWDTSGSASFNVKLWDGTTVIASGNAVSPGANNAIVLALSGYITNPAGNIRISVKDTSTTNGVIKANLSTGGKDGTVSAIRIQ